MMHFLRTLLALVAFCCTSLVYAQTQLGLDIDSEAGGDVHGWSVSMPDAFTVGIGAIRNDGGGNWSGHVRIHTWNGSAWVQKGADIDGKAAEDRIGWGVTMPDANTVGFGSGEQAGKARVYAWNGSAWVQKGTDFAPEGFYDRFGYSMSMPDPNTVAIGAPSNNGAASHAGHVRIFAWDGNAWVQKGADIDGQAQSDQFGTSVSMPDSNTVAIGAQFANGGGSMRGQVRIFSWNGSAWIQKGGNINGEATNDNSGFSVSMPSANTVAITAMGNYGGAPGTGQVRVYAWNGSAWVQKGGDIDGEAQADRMGRSVSMPDDNTLAVGATQNDGSGLDAGSVRIYAWSGTAWLQVGSDIDGEAAGDNAGFTVSMPDASTVAIGAPFNRGHGTESGHVRIYNMSPVGMLETKPKAAFMVYPNPTHRQFSIDFSEDQRDLTIRIERLNGQLVSESQHSFARKLEMTLDAEPGMYLMRIMASGVSLGNVKVVVQ